jgi:hypothetical protein
MELIKITETKKKLKSMSYEELLVFIEESRAIIDDQIDKIHQMSIADLDLMMQQNMVFESFNDFPQSIDNFEKFYAAVKGYCLGLEKVWEVDDLIEWIENNVLCLNSWSKAYLLDELLFHSAWVQKIEMNGKKKESFYVTNIIKNFDSIFPDYEFVKREKTIVGGRVDIFAKDKVTGRDVIIEVKVGCANPIKQLKRYYRCHGGNPILVAITQEECKKKDNGIVYVVYQKGVDFIRKKVEESHER